MQSTYMLCILYNLGHQLILYEKQTLFRGLNNIIINIIITGILLT